MDLTRHTDRQIMICLTFVTVIGHKNGVMISLASVSNRALRMLTIVEYQLITTEYVVIIDN